MAKFQFQTLINDFKVITARVGTVYTPGSTANQVTELELGKFLKLAGDSRYDLAVAGDEIEAFLTSIEVAPQDGYTIGSVVRDAIFKNVTFDGLQATPGTGVIAIGDYVVVGTAPAKGTAIVSGLHAKVTKATTQATAKTSPFAWRVESLGTAGSGAVGTAGLIRRVK